MKLKINPKIKAELKKVGKGALIAMAGALLTYLAQWASSTNFGEYTPIVVAVVSVLVNFGRKLLIIESK